MTRSAPHLMLISALIGLVCVATVHAQEPGHGPPARHLPGERPPPGFPPPPPPPPPLPPPPAAQTVPALPAPSIAAPDPALEAARSALESVRHGSDGEALSAGLLRLAALLDERGRTREALPLLREALGLADNAQDERRAQTVATQLAAAHGRLGEAEQAVFWRQRADIYRDRFSSRLLQGGSANAQHAPVQTVAAGPAATIEGSIPEQGGEAPVAGALASPEPRPMWPWIVAALCGVLLLAWWRTRQRAAALEEEALQLHRRQQRAQTINARLQAESEQLRKQAVQDTLTGALTRHAFASSLKDLLLHAGHYGRPVALLVMDLDHFKSINDQFGHLSGDAALKLVVGIARENLGSGDLLGRFGGDEFLVAAIDHDPAMALALGEAIRKSVAQRAGATPALARLRVSIGIAHATPASGYDLEHLFQRADAALYAAKRSGRDRVAIESEHDPAPTDQPSLRQLSASAAEGEAAGAVTT